MPFKNAGLQRKILKGTTAVNVFLHETRQLHKLLYIMNDSQQGFAELVFWD